VLPAAVAAGDAGGPRRRVELVAKPAVALLRRDRAAFLAASPVRGAGPASS